MPPAVILPVVLPLPSVAVMHMRMLMERCDLHRILACSLPVRSCIRDHLPRSSRVEGLIPDPSLPLPEAEAGLLLLLQGGQLVRSDEKKHSHPLVMMGIIDQSRRPFVDG